MSNDGRILQIYRDGRRWTAQTRLRLPIGAEANLHTMNEAAKIVREDSRFPDLGNFVMREVIGLENTTLSERIDAAYRFCRDKIVYEPEGKGTETIADLWSCMYALNPLHPTGDCMVKSTALATAFSFLGLKPYFVAIRQIPNVDYFNHVFVGIKEGGRETGFDPTPPEFRAGQQLGYLERLNFVIFK